MTPSMEGLTSLKKDLISSKTGTFFSDLESGKISPFQEIFSILRDANDNESLQILCCDVLSIWLLRYTGSVAQKKTQPGQYNISESDFTALFQYIIDFLEQGSGPFVNALNGLLLKTVSACKTLSPETLIFQCWIDLIMQISITSRTLYNLTEIIAKQLPSTQYIIDKYPNFTANCLSLMWSDALANAASKALATIYRGSNSNGSSLWQEPVLEALENSDLRKNIQTYLLPLLFVAKEAFPQFMHYITSKVDTKSLSDLDLLIGVAKVGQDLAIITEPFDPNSDSMIPLKLLVQIMTHNSSKYRIGSFALFVGSPKSSQAIPQYILDTLQQENIIESFFMDYEDTDIRNDFCSYMRQFLIRVRDSAYAINRDLVKLQKKSIDEAKQEQYMAYLLSLRIFLEWMIELIRFNLSPGSNYVQISLALQIYEYLLNLGLDGSVKSSTTNKKTTSEFPFSIELFNDSFICILLDNITNNYEDIRENSVKLLLLCPVRKLVPILSDPSIIKTSSIILADLKGRKSEGGARVFQFLVRAYQENNDNKSVFELINLLTAKIDSIQEANDVVPCDFIPMQERIHGIFSALRLILLGLSPKIFCQNECFWRELFSKLVNQQYPRVWISVKPILSNTKGDLNNVDDERLVLNYSWKLVKESTLYLQTALEISSRYAIKVEELEFLSVVDIVIDQLSSVNHRGAFSSVYPTFVTCCEVCLKLENLSHKPVEWLKKNIQLIEVKSQYISRRSGGLPYLITGILTAEKNVKRKGSTSNIEYSMNELIRIASIPYTPNADEKMDIPQVHAFNSMKHVFIDSQLSNESLPYIKEGLRLSLLNCDSKTWAIRNCAFMLFAALQNRFFGTKKLGDILPTLNATSFFAKYLGVEDIFFDMLSNESASIESVFPVLTILMRLEDFTSGALQKFQPLLYKKLGHKGWKVREIAARSLAGILRPNEIENFCMRLIEEVATGENGLNRNHGNLLTVLEIIKRINLKLPDEKISNKCLNFLISNISKFVIFNDKTTFNWATNKVYIDILLEVKELSLSSNAINYLASFVCNRLIITKGEMIVGLEQLTLQDTITLLLNQHMMAQQYEDCLQLIRLCIYSHEAYEVQLTGVTFCEKYLDQLIYKDNKILSTLFDDLWSEIISNQNCWSLVKSTSLGLFEKILSKTTDKSFKTEELRSIVNLLKDFTKKGSYSEDVNSMALRALGPLNADLNDAFYIDVFFDLVRKFSLDDEPFICRMAAISSVASFLSKTTENTDSYQVCRAAFFLYFSLWDDDRDIRDLSSKSLSEFLRFNYNSSNIAVAKYFTTNAQKLFKAEDIENIIIPIFCDKSQSVAQKLKLIQGKEEDINSLFDIENVNLYRNEPHFHLQICGMISNLPQIQIESKQLMQGMMIEDLKEGKEFIERKGFHGYIGWAKDEVVFCSIFRLLLNIKLMKKLDIFMLNDNDLNQKLVEIDIHPLLKNVL